MKRVSNPVRPTSLLICRRSFVASAFLAPAAARTHAVDMRNAAPPNPKSHFSMRVYGSRVEWESRSAHLRRQILSAAGLLPRPDRSNVRHRIIRRVRYDGYVAEVFLLETLPGFFVGCTLYRPPDECHRKPAVLVPHGHWKRGRVEHLPSYSVPALAINLARQGYVALSWDMLGYNDTRQIEHSFGGWREQLWGFNPLGLQLWNSICALDYLSSRSDVDPQRIACTGASGGATQTILLSAVDDRVACSAPVNMISAHYQGADPCEEAPNLRLGTNNVEIAALMAPRPMLVVSCTGDWTKNTPVEEFPAIQRVYALYGNLDRIENRHFEAEHNYDRHTREAVYAFFARHLQHRNAQPEDCYVGQIDAQSLLASENYSGFEGALEYDRIFENWVSASIAKNSAITDASLLREQLRHALGCSWPSDVHHKTWGDYAVLSRKPGERIPALWLAGRGTATVVVHAEGKQAAMGSEVVRCLRQSGSPVLLIDAFQTGNAVEARHRGGRWRLSYSQTDDANRVQDILTSLRFAQLKTDRTPKLVGLGKAAVWSTFAAAVAPTKIELDADLGAFSGTDEEMRECLSIPCIQRAGGLDAALRILGRKG